jgi:hypothetical protein
LVLEISARTKKDDIKILKCSKICGINIIEAEDKTITLARG